MNEECFWCYGVADFHAVDNWNLPLDYVCAKCFEYAREDMFKYVGEFSVRALA